MKLLTMLASAFFAFAPAATTLAQQYPREWEAQDYQDYEAPNITRQQGETTLRVVPPLDRTVFVYEGTRPIARFDEPGVMTVPTGRSYGVIAQRAGRQIWSGHVAATGPSLSVAWPRPTYGQGDQQVYPPSTQYAPGIQQYGTPAPLEQGQPRYYIEPPPCRQEPPHERSGIALPWRR